jgi:hypothetical protein
MRFESFNWQRHYEGHEAATDNNQHMQKKNFFGPEVYLKLVTAMIQREMSQHQKLT